LSQPGRPYIGQDFMLLVALNDNLFDRSQFLGSYAPVGAAKDLKQGVKKGTTKTTRNDSGFRKTSMVALTISMRW